MQKISLFGWLVGSAVVALTLVGGYGAHLTNTAKADRPGNGGGLPVSGTAASLRCGTPRPTSARARVMRDAIQRYLNRPGNGGSSSRNPGTVTVNVYFHVIRENTTLAGGNIPLAWITNQITAMNCAFQALDRRSAGQNPSDQASADTPFRFVLASVDRTTNAGWFNTLIMGGANEIAMKNALRTGTAKDLNIYSVLPDSGLLGWATFPDGAAGNLSYDGVVLHYQSLPHGNLVGYNLGDTGTHEVGHWLGLFHTFEAGCDTTNDEVADTPAEAAPFFGCPPPYPDSCTGAGFPGRDPLENYMDYTDDRCMYQFTAGQSTRMDALAATLRGL